MKKFICSLCGLLMLLLSTTSQAAWPNGGGGAGFDNVVAIETSASGFTYVLGEFEGTANFGGFELNSTGLKDVYLLKVKQNGDVEWAIKAGSASQVMARDLTVDESDNVYIVGAFYGTLFIGGDDLINNHGLPNGFVAKANSMGQWQWAYHIGSSGNESEATLIESIEGDSTVIPPEEGSVFVSGFYREGITIRGNDPDSINDISKTLTNGLGPKSSELFIARYEHDGDLIWAEDRGAQSTHGEKPTAMEVNDNGRMYVFGESSGEVDIYQEDFESIGDFGFPGGWYSNWNNNSCPYNNDRAHGVKQHNKPGNNTRDFYISGVPQYNDSNNWLNNTYIYTSSWNTTEVGSYTISVDIFEGTYSFSEPPDNGENFYIYLADPNGSNLVLLDSFSGGGATTNGTFTYKIPASLKPNGASLVFFKGVSTFACGDFWHFDNIVIEGNGTPENFAFQVTQSLSNSPSIGTSTTLPTALDIADVAYDSFSNKLAISGTNTVSGTNYCQDTLPSGSFVANLNMDSTNFNCDWVKTSEFDSQSVGAGITLDGDGNIYQIGTFSGSMSFNNVDNQCLGQNISNETINSFDNTDDVFMLSYRNDGVHCWLTGGNYFDASDSYPAIIGEIEQERGVDISTDGSSLYLVGDFNSSILLGEDIRFDGQGETDMFVTNWGLDGRPFQVESWPVGVALTPPTNAYLGNANLLPDVYQDGEQLTAPEWQELLYWAGPIPGQPEGRLIPLQPFSELEVHWRKTDSPQDDDRIITVGGANWPTEPCDSNIIENCYQIHVSGAPVEVEPPSGDSIFF
ncbi:MAG: hypothetical protein OQK49_01935, partial [Proteobacteria bacterium]|nr:hypothetical protein [Pseudomonadota bacterium]